MKNNLLKYTLALLISMFWVWVLFAFFNWEANPSLWGTTSDERAGLGGIYGLIVLLSIFFLLQSNFGQKKL